MRRSERRLALACLLAVFPAFTTTWAADPAVPPRIRYATLPFVFSPPHGDLQWLTEAFALGIGDRMELLGFTVTSRRERIEAAESLGLASPSPMTLAGRLKLARGLRATRAVTGTLTFQPEGDTRAGAGQVVVTSLLLDVAHGTVIGRRTISGTLNELFSMLDELALEMAWQDPAAPGPEARKMLRSIQDPPLPSFEMVVKAILEKDPDRQQSAIEAARPVVRHDPMLSRRVADLLIEVGRSEEALAILGGLDPAGQPDPWRLHLDRAELLLARGNLEAARGAAARSVVARDNAPAHILLARAAIARGDPTVARSEARLAFAIDPLEPGLGDLLEQVDAPAADASPRR